MNLTQKTSKIVYPTQRATEKNQQDQSRAPSKFKRCFQSHQNRKKNSHIMRKNHGSRAIWAITRPPPQTSKHASETGTKDTLAKINFQT